MRRALKRLLASIGESLVRRFGRPTYMVVYDVVKDGQEEESYYGYFSSPEEAKEVFEIFAHGQTFNDVRLVRDVESWNHHFVRPDPDA